MTTSSSKNLSWLPIGLAGFAICCSVAWTGDAHWPQFRGPQASGIGEGQAPPLRWELSSGENVLWRVPVAGLAHSSPIVWGDRVYVTTAVKPGEAELKVGLYGDIASVNEPESHQWRLLAFDLATGRELWNTLAHEGVPRQRRHTKASQCNSTPATDGKHIVALLGSEGLFCFDADGHRLWRRDLGPMDAGPYTTPTEQWGFGSSPVIHAGAVIVQCDTLSGQFLAKFDLEDGRELWRASRREVATWSTPTVVTTGGRPQIIVNGWRTIGSYDFHSGQPVWWLSGGGDAPIPTPVAAHGLVYLTSAHGRWQPMRAVRLDAAGDITPSEVGMTNTAVAWVHPRHGNYLQTPLVTGDLLYGCTDYGLVTCFDAATGRIHYRERLKGRSQGFTASPVAAAGRLYFTGELGDVFVLRAGRDFEVLACNQLNEHCLATPALANGRIVFRTRSHLVAIGDSHAAASAASSFRATSR
ncbi:MAG: PQQ-binding-like beta-propeller repeat protein [Verrucomicrobia bacterium]|nr:PQQ-binding-like beta-propeller repeat protein [Verrucomicrobiota bacterium]